MKLQQIIEQKLSQGLSPSYLEVENESHRHNVPPNSESHFRVVVVSDQFDEKRLLQRHRLVNQLLAEELANGVHALAMHTYTATEWSERKAQAPDPTQCKGGA